jgi:hypothetical protein
MATAVDTTTLPHFVHVVGNVFTRSTWSDTWTARPDLYCISMRVSSGLTIGEARFVFSYGNISHNAVLKTVVPPLNLNGHWVKVEWTPNSGPGGTEKWFGKFVLDARDRLGDDPAESGDQTLIAFGPEWLLTQRQIFESHVEAPTVSGPVVQKIDRGIAFNARERRSSELFGVTTGNRSKTSYSGPPNTHYVFAENLDDARRWTVGNIIDYMLNFFQPLVTGPTFTFDPSPFGLVTDWYEPNDVRVWGNTVFHVAHCNRRIQ